MTQPPRLLELFAGIGGLGLGLHHALAARTVAVAEHDSKMDYPAAVLARRFPDAPNLGDVSQIRWETVAERHGPIDIIAGGFPCQDISLAGKGAGITGQRSGLWRHFADAIRVLRPRVVVVENVSALLTRGFDRVLADLAACGMAATWDCIPAAAVGAPHRRDRIFLIAYPERARRDAPVWPQPAGVAARRPTWPTPDAAAFNTHQSIDAWAERKQRERKKGYNGNGGGVPLGMAVRLDDAGRDWRAPETWPTPTSTDAKGSRGFDLEGNPLTPTAGVTLTDAVQPWRERQAFPTPVVNDSRNATAPPSQAQTGGRNSDTLAHVAGSSVTAPLNPGFVEWLMGFPQGWTDLYVDEVPPRIDVDPWSAGEWPDTPRTLADVKHRRGRLHALGNAVVPQCAAHVGEVIKRNRLLGE